MTKEKVNKEQKEEKEFIPIHFDALFYKVFGDDNDTEPLKYLIKQVLNINPVEVQILNGKVLGDKYKTKRSYLDLQVKLEDETKVIIEVNTNKDSYIFDRNYFFLSKVVGNALDVGKGYSNLKKHYQINFNVHLSQTEPIMIYKLIDENTKEVLTDKVEIINIDIAYFAEKCYTSSDREKLNDFEKIMGLLGSVDEQQTSVFSKEEGIMMHIMEKADKFRNSDEVIELFDRDKVMNYEKELEKEKAVKEAVLENTEKVTKKVTKEVTKEVKSNTTREIAMSLLKEDVSVDIISKTTGLSIDEINILKNI